MSDRIVNLRYSADGGNNWSDWRLLDMGEVGAFIKTLEERRFGRGRLWIFETMVSSNVRCDVLDASWEAEVVR